MLKYAKQKLLSLLGKCLLFCILFISSFHNSYAQPANDNCGNAQVINITNSGYDIGTFSSSNIDLTSATVQAGETFAKAIFIAGQTQKSIWFKFTLPTNRGVRVTLLQSGSVITAGDVGFAVYKTNACLPSNGPNGDESKKLTPIQQFGYTEHPCVEPGEYLVQVSAKANVSGTVYVQVHTDTTPAIYDRPKIAYEFGKLSSPTSHIDFPVDCQSLDNAAEMCTALSNYQQYKKSTWHTFTTPDYFDYLSVLMASPNGGFANGENVFGYRLYKGNAVTTAASSLTPVGSCDSLKTGGYYPAYKLYKCGVLDPNTTYSVQLLYKQDFEQNIRLAIAFGGITPTQAPQPILSSIPASNQLGALASSATVTDYLACNSRHSLHPCGDALPAAGIKFNGDSYNLSTFYTFTLTSASNISLSAYSSTCGNPSLLLRLYKQNVSNNCTSLSSANLTGEALTNLSQECISPGTYTLQISGRDTASPEYNYTYGSLGGGSPLCMLSNLGQQVNLSISVNAVNALNQFSLNVNGAYDKINSSGNSLTALQTGVSYQAMPDTFGCSPTVLPSDKLCDTTYNKAMYREFLIADSGVVSFTNRSYSFLYKLYKGDANALATQQNKHSFPDRISGLTPYSECRNYYQYCIDDKVCVVPGNYTLTTFGGGNYVNIQDQPSLQFNTLNTKHFSPATAQDMGSILDSASNALTSDVDYFSCKDNAVNINGYEPCSISGHAATKVIYRQFYLKTPSIVTISGSYNCGYNPKTLFSGKVSNGLTGLQPLGGSWNCFTSSAATDPCKPLPAGWYTVVSYGSGPTYQNPLKDLNEKGYGSYVATSDQFTITVSTACEGPGYNRPYKASIDTITKKPFLIDWPSDRSYAAPKYLYTEHFNCTVDTPFNSQITACYPSLNRIAYYVFRTTKKSSIQFSFQGSSDMAYSIYALDVRTDSALLRTAAPVLSCSNVYANSQLCNLPPGTYTLVVFAGDGSNCSYITPVISKPCNEPWYNRPYKAAVDTVTKSPFLIEWASGTAGTSAYPKTDTTYNLYTEYFDCSTDTPFTTHPVMACDATVNRVAYYTFRITKESYIQINTQGLWGSVYALDVRKDSALLKTATPVQPCLQSSGYIQLCRLQPGVYTLIVFAGDNYRCSSVTPSIYIDQVGYSRYDHANKAYDFGVIPGDSLYHSGKAGDVNPLNTGRAPSNDFFYCTTGSQNTDPTESACYVDYNPLIYNTGVNNYLFTSSSTNSTARRNLWYSFVIDKPGNVSVKVTNKTTGKQTQYPYAIYTSDVDPLVPFSTIRSTGLIDSTTSQGLTFFKSNRYLEYYCYSLSEEISFYRDPCTFTPTRYYIVVDNNSGLEPNSQVEVSILLDSTSAILPKFDHYYQASDMGNVGVGTYKGATDNYTCASADPNDPVYNDYYNCAKKTLWYKFTSTITGQIRYRIYNNGVRNTSNDKIQLFREIIPGDSTANGLAYQNSSSYYDNTDGSYWLQNCVAPGTYYILLTGCNQVNEFTYPEIQLAEQAGDFCSAAVPAAVNGPGQFISTVLVDCHTIGTDYGEFGPNLTCPANAKTNEYKSSWFKIDISGNDTLDVTAFLSENTTASPSEIQYRLMTGNCGAMQEQSCVQDAQTQNTYKCLAPGSYFVQVFTPITKNGYLVTGNIDLHLNAVKHADSCAPVSNCLANANFIPQFDCTTDSVVRFVNYSTYGSSIIYKWDFGYGGRTSSEVSPSFFYPALATDKTYIVKLETENTSCGGKSSVSVPVNIPGRPAVNLGSDIKLCEAGSSVMLDATSFSGAKYLWQDGSVNATFNATLSGENKYTVKVTYNNCLSTDTIKVFINPIEKNSLKNYVLCGGDSVQLYDYRGYGETYLWNTGYSGSSFYAKSPGIYWADILLNGCTVRDSFNVTSIANAHPLGDDRSVCSVSFPYKLDATTIGASDYRWEDGTGGAQHIVSAPGLYWVDVFTGNCSFRDTITLSVVSSVMSNVSVTLCEGKSYALPSGRVINQTGVYKDTLRNVSGCDSLISSVNLTIKPPPTSKVNASICLGQTYTLPSGQIVNTDGVYKDTLSVSGCDSIVTVTLTVLSAVTSTTNTTICTNQLPYKWNDSTYTSAGTYAVTLKSTASCDSIATLVLTVSPPLTSTTNTTICTNQLPYKWNDSTYTSAGTYAVTLKSTASCDSVATLVLTVAPPLTSTTNTTICTNQLPYKWNDSTYTSAGTYAVTLKSTASCDSIATLVLTVSPPLTSTTNTTICTNQLPYKWNDSTYTSAGTYAVTLKSTTSCDSVATLVLTVSPTLTSTTNTTICTNQLPYKWNDSTYTSAGTYAVTLKSTASCDSVATLVLTVAPPLTSTTNTTICTNQLPYKWNDSTYTSAGTYAVTLKSTASCDSIATLVLTVSPPLTSTTNTTICTNQLPYKWNDSTYTSAGTYAVTLKSTTSCDSVATLVLTVSPTLTSTTNTTICTNQLPYKWNDSTYTSAGTYAVTLKSTTSCDSVATLILNVSPTLTSTTSTTICTNQLPYKWNDSTYTSAGTYAVTLKSTASCDSVATLVLTVAPPLTSTTNTTICTNQLPYKWNNNIYTLAGTYYVTLKSTASCDSIATLILTVSPTLTSTTNTTICTNQLPYKWNDSTYTSAGTYAVTLKSGAGCDSVATLVLTVAPPLTSTTNTTICTNQLPYKWNDSTYTSAGTYAVTLKSTASCDSVATLVLTVAPPLTSTTNTTICTNQLPYKWNDSTYTSAGTYAVTLKSTASCDSIATLVLTVSPPLTSTTNTTICTNQLPYKWNDSTYTSAGTYAVTLKSGASCDSVATLILTVAPNLSSTTSTTICTNQLPYTWNDSTYTSAGTYAVALKSGGGCDSVATLILKVTPTLSSTTSTTICTNQLPYTWNDSTYTSAGTYSVTLKSGAGCDSVATLTLAVAPNLTTTTNVTMCSNQLPYTWNDSTYTSAGTYSVTLKSGAGCDSVATLILTVYLTPIANAGPDKQVNQGDTTILTPVVSGSDLNYKWTPNLYFLSPDTLKNPFVLGVTDISYFLIVTGDGQCQSKPDEVVVKVLKQLKPIFIPNVFSPNGDGINDVWHIRELETYPEAIVNVYNRFGVNIFSSTGYKTPWDGKHKGQPVPIGVYYYVIYTNKQSKPLSGWVTILK